LAHGRIGLASTACKNEMRSKIMSLPIGRTRLFLMKSKMRTTFRMRPTPRPLLQTEERVGERIQTTLNVEPSPDFRDPRLRPDFERACWPLRNGKPAPRRNSQDLYDRRCLEFLAAYYQLNFLNNRLQASRKARVSQHRIRALLDKIASATAALEALEDHYAPIGFFGEPVMKGIRYQNIIFVRPELPRLHQKASTLSSHFAIPDLDKIPASELRGPVKIFRFAHGKMDL
jgi:hypothetical protein